MKRSTKHIYSIMKQLKRKQLKGLDLFFAERPFLLDMQEERKIIADEKSENENKMEVEKIWLELISAENKYGWRKIEKE